MRAGIEGTDDEFIALLSVGSNARVKYTKSSLPEFTRGMDLMSVVLSEPMKVKALIENGYEALPEHIEEAESRITEAYEDDSDVEIDKAWLDSYVADIKKSIALLQRSLIEQKK